MSTLNWAELVKDSGDSSTGDFGPLPAGDYHLKVAGVEVKRTSTDKTMFSLTAVVQGGAYTNRRLWDNLVVSPESSGAMGFFFRKMKALGLDENFFATNPTDDQIANAMANREFKAKIKIGSYQGKPKNEFDAYAPLGAAAPTFSSPPPAAAPQAAAPQPVAAPPAPAPAPQQAAPAPAVAPAPAAAPPADPWAQQAPPAQATGAATPPPPPF